MRETNDQRLQVLQRHFQNEIAKLRDKGKTYTPFLVIPYNQISPLPPGDAADFGRVRPVPNGVPFYLSPFILTLSTAGFGFTAVAGEENFVYARVFNFGRAVAAPTQVDFYWADPSLGLGPGSFNFIGTQWTEVPNAGRSKMVRCSTPWVPSFLNGGHECLLVQCSNPQIAIGGTPPYGLFDPITAPFMPTLDRHVAQRNIAVIQSEPGGQFDFQLGLNNFLPFEMKAVIRNHMARVVRAGRAGREHTDTQLVIQAIRLTVAGGFRREERVTGNAKRPGDTLVRIDGAGRAPSLRSRVGDIVGVLDTEGLRVRASQLLAARSEQTRGEIIHELAMEPGEQRTLHLELGVPEDLKPGMLAVYDLTQWMDSALVGGYTVVVRSR